MDIICINLNHKESRKNAIFVLYKTGYHYPLKTVALELIGLDRPTMYFCWYVPFYCISMLLLLALKKLICKSKFFTDVLIMLAIPAVLRLARYIIGNVYIVAILLDQIVQLLIKYKDTLFSKF